MSKVYLKDVVTRIKDKVDKDNTDLEYYIGGEHFDNGEIQITKKGVIAGSTIGPAFHMRFVPGDVLLMSRNPHLRKAGVVDFEGICSDVSYVCRTKDENVLMQKFLPFIFQSDDFWRFAEENKKGSTNFFLNWSDFEKYEFNLPTIETQRKLVELLWSFEDTKTAYKKLLDKTDELVKSQFIEMFGELDKNTKQFPVRMLNEISSYWNGLTYKPEDVVEDGTLVLRSGNIQNSALAFDDNVYVNCVIKDKLFVQDNDILMCSRNGSAALVGKTALIKGLKEPATFGAFMMIIRSEYYSYLKTYFELPFFRNQISTGTSTINQITGKMLNEISLPVPDMDTVRAFEEFTEQSDKSKFELKQAIADIDNLARALIHQELN